MKSKVLRVSVVTKLGRLFLAIAVLLSSAVAFGSDTGNNGASKFRWDLLNIDLSTNPPTILPGGVNSSLAQDGSRITLTGTGMFVVPATGGPSSAVSGGGTWTTTDPSGTKTGSGNYTVVRLVRFDERNTVPFGANDGIGNIEDIRGGLAFLTVAFDDGTQGVLAISCNEDGDPINFEGITTSKGSVYYWNQQKPPVGNIFHIIKGHD